MPVRQISAAEAVEAVRAGALLLDVREPDEWAAAHVAGALHIPLADLAARLHELPHVPETLVICRSGGRSDVAAEALAGIGRVGMANVEGGMKAWVRNGLAIEPADGVVI